MKRIKIKKNAKRAASERGRETEQEKANKTSGARESKKAEKKKRLWLVLQK